jgi:opacity protein-like surface antigen
MKKIINLSILSAVLLGTVASADCTMELCKKKENMNWNETYTVTSKDSKGKEYFLNIKDIKRDVHIGLASANIEGDHVADFTGGVGISGIVSNDYYVGANLDAEILKTNGDVAYGLTGELKGGYVFNKDISGYAIVGLKSLNFNNNVDALGVGYGIGAEYKLCPQMAIDAEWKRYNMNVDSSLPEYSQGSVGIIGKYFF